MKNKYTKSIKFMTFIFLSIFFIGCVTRETKVAPDVTVQFYKKTSLVKERDKEYNMRDYFMLKDYKFEVKGVPGEYRSVQTYEKKESDDITSRQWEVKLSEVTKALFIENKDPFNWESYRDTIKNMYQNLKEALKEYTPSQENIQKAVLYMDGEGKILGGELKLFENGYKKEEFFFKKDKFIGGMRLKINNEKRQGTIIYTYENNKENKFLETFENGNKGVFIRKNGEKIEYNIEIKELSAFSKVDDVKSSGWEEIFIKNNNKTIGYFKRISEGATNSSTIIVKVFNKNLNKLVTIATIIVDLNPTKYDKKVVKKFRRKLKSDWRESKARIRFIYGDENQQISKEIRKENRELLDGLLELIPDIVFRSDKDLRHDELEDDEYYITQKVLNREKINIEDIAKVSIVEDGAWAYETIDNLFKYMGY